MLTLFYIQAGSLEALEVVAIDQNCSLVPVARSLKPGKTSVFSRV